MPCLFFSALASWSLQMKKLSLMECLFFDADFFYIFFILADKISRSAKFWAPIQILNSVAAWERPHLNWRCDFVRFLRICQNAWTSSLCPHLKNDFFWINTVVLWTRKTKLSFHNINSWISSILEIPACIFSPYEFMQRQSYVDHILCMKGFTHKVSLEITYIKYVQRKDDTSLPL